MFERARNGELSLRRTYAVVVHGDEGRSKRKSAFLVLNWHSTLGRGVETALSEANNPYTKKYLKMLPNFVGHSYTSRFMLSALPKEDYTGKRSFAFDTLMQAVAEEIQDLAVSGITHDGETHFLYCVGCVGDWPWLQKSGQLERTFMNVPKHGGNVNRADCKGICHLCKAGQRDWPYEEIATRNPTWVASLLVQPPFDEANHRFSIIPHIPGTLPTFWKFDLFHCVHLGIAKNYLGSMLALLSELEPAGNVDSRFELLTAKYLGFCAESHRQAHCKRLTKESLNWISKSHFPTGAWHKGDLSTSLLLFCEHRFHREQWEDETLQLAGQAVQSLNKCVKILFHGGAWLSQDDALQAAQLGLQFMRRYSALASLSHQKGAKYWLVMPKMHCFHHICLDMLWGSSKGPTINPLIWSVQQDEDFIGRGSRLSRHVSAVNASERTVDRYLMATYAEFMACGYLVGAPGA